MSCGTCAQQAQATMATAGVTGSQVMASWAEGDEQPHCPECGAWLSRGGSPCRNCERLQASQLQESPLPGWMQDQPEEVVEIWQRVEALNEERQSLLDQQNAFWRLPLSERTAERRASHEQVSRRMGEVRYALEQNVRQLCHAAVETGTFSAEMWRQSRDMGTHVYLAEIGTEGRTQLDRRALAASRTPDGQRRLQMAMASLEGAGQALEECRAAQQSAGDNHERTLLSIEEHVLYGALLHQQARADQVSLPPDWQRRNAFESFRLWLRHPDGGRALSRAERGLPLNATYAAIEDYLSDRTPEGAEDRRMAEGDSRAVIAGEEDVYTDEPAGRVYIRIPPNVRSSALRRHLEGTPYVILGHDGQNTEDGVVINWGSTRESLGDGQHVLLNSPEAVQLVRDKVQSLQALGDLAPKTVFEAAAVEELGPDFVAKKASGSRADKLVVRAGEYDPAQLEGYDVFQEWVPDRTEYRLNMLSGQVVSAYRKVPPEGTTEEDTRPGWRYEPAEAELPPEALAVVREAQERLGIDLAGFDLVRNGQTGEWKVLEANAAPGMGPRTLVRLFNAIQDTLRAAA